MLLINRRHESVNSNWGHARSLSVLMYWVLPEFALESQARSRQPYARLRDAQSRDAKNLTGAQVRC